MAASLTLWPVSVETGSADEDGRLVFARGRLVAVLVRLSAATHPEEALRGKWFLEAGFGPCAAQAADPFPTLAHAVAWLHAQLARGVRPYPAPGT